jgi:parvulin-like peptidyl-prolyl isomerase
VSSDELEKGVAKYKSGYTDQVFNESLLEGMVEEDLWRERVRETLLIQKLFDQSRPQIQKPNNQDALEYFERHSASFRKNAQASALHLVVRDDKTAREVRQKISKSTLTFVAAAQEFSVGPEAQSGAKISVDQGVLPEALDRYLFEGPIGELSPVLKSSYGYHLLRVLSRSPAVNQDFKQVKEQILARLYEERRQGWLEKFEEGLIRSAEIEYNRELIGKL